MGVTIGERVRTERALRGWTQEDLDLKSGVGLRTIQRLEANQVNPHVGTLASLAAAFDTDVSRLLTGLLLEEITDLAEEYSCRVCGAKLVERTFVDHEHGDCEFEVFGCGATQGWQYRPCPRSSDFPEFADYDLVVTEEQDGRYFCYARGRTEHAQSVHLGNCCGTSEEEACRQVRWQYVALMHDDVVADKEVGPRWPS